MLEEKPRELGVDFLVCVTNRRMRSDDDKDIYQWWSADPTLPILIFSTAGLGLRSLGPAAGRAVANQLVESLASQLLESVTQEACIHEAGDKYCPFYYNGERDAKLIFGRKKFEKSCRDKLLEKLPETLGPDTLVAAFEALLAAYDQSVVETKAAAGL